MSGACAGIKNDTPVVISRERVCPAAVPDLDCAGRSDGRPVSPVDLPGILIVCPYGRDIPRLYGQVSDLPLPDPNDLIADFDLRGFCLAGGAAARWPGRTTLSAQRRRSFGGFCWRAACWRFIGCSPRCPFAIWISGCRLPPCGLAVLVWAATRTKDLKRENHESSERARNRRKGWKPVIGRAKPAATCWLGIVSPHPAARTDNSLERE